MPRTWESVGEDVGIGKIRRCMLMLVGPKVSLPLWRTSSSELRIILNKKPNKYIFVGYSISINCYAR
jgi:hypothetical protein